MTDDYRALFDANPRPMFVFDRETLGFLLVNDAACALYEWSRDELLAMTLRDVRLPEDVPRLEAAVAEARTLPKLPQIAARHRTRSGKLLDVIVEMTRLQWRGREATLAIIEDITGANEAERRMRLLAEHSHEGVSISDARGIVRYLSPAGERLLGLAPGAMIGQVSTRDIHPDDLKKYAPMAPGETRVHVYRCRHADGSWRWIEATATNLTLDPAVRGYVSNFRDISARVEAQRRLEYLLSVTSAVTWTARLEGGCTFISANVREVLGYEPEQFYTPGFFYSNVHADDRASVQTGIARVVAQGAYVFEYRYHHADGRVRWILDQAKRVGDEIVGAMMDVTDRKVAEEAVRLSEQKFRTLIERSPTLVLVHRKGTIIFANPAAVRLLGYDSPDELVGMSALEITHPDDRESVRVRIEHTLRHGGGAPGEARLRRRDGSYVSTEGEGIVMDYDGAPATVVVGHDVTQRKELFARMALADRLLSVGTLAAGVAHEINNPLAYVSSNLELLKRELPLLLAGGSSSLSRTEIEELLADARDGAARVGAIVRDLRALSRSDDDGSGPVDVATVLASCIKMAHNEIRHRATVTTAFDTPLPGAAGNASRLGQVFLNLLVNAAQAIPEGRSDANEIRVRAFAARDGEHVVVEIEDTGAGIPRSVIERIFDPFFTTKPVGLGTGLGLSISHQIVRSLGGRIEVDSTVGVGTVFRVVLPIARERTRRADAAAAVTPVPTTRVLVIDDEVAVGRSISLLLAPDYEVTAVTRAHDALERIGAGERFDAIVCDVMMPEMSGIELYQQLARSAPEQLARVVFLTGGAFTVQARDFLATAQRPQLDKPFTERDLRRAIDRVTSPVRRA